MSNSPDDDELDCSIAFVLAQFQYQPPRTRCTDERRRYFRAAARAVRKQLQFAWVLQKKPPQRLAQSAWTPPDADG